MTAGSPGVTTLVQPSRSLFIAGIFGLTSVGLLLRLDGIANRSLWLDEIGQAVVATLPWPEFWDGVRSHAAAAPLDYLGQRAIMAFLGSGTAEARIWALACSVAAIPAIAWLVLEIFRSTSAALAASFLLTISAFHISYGQEARFYSLSLMVGLVLIAAFSRAIRRGGWINWALFSVAAATALHSHYFLAIPLLLGGLSIALAGILALPAGGTRWVRIGLAYGASIAVAAAAFIPWYFFAAAEQAATSFPGSGPQPLSIVEVRNMLLNLIAPSFGASPPDNWRAISATILIALAGAGFLGSKPLRRPDVLVVGLVAAGLIPIAWLLVARANYFLADRQLILVPSLLYVLASGALIRLPRPTFIWRPVPMIVAAALWAVLAAPSITAVKSVDWRNHEDWRGAAAYVASGLCPGGRVYVNLGRAYQFGLGYYESAVWDAAREIEGTPESIVNLSTISADWVVIRKYHYFVGGPQGLDNITRQLGSRGYLFRDFPALRVFVPPEAC